MIEVCRAKLGDVMQPTFIAATIVAVSAADARAAYHYAILRWKNCGREGERSEARADQQDGFGGEPASAISHRV
jgi:hypothetical protein